MARQKKDRLTREELKGPDEFQESMAKVLEFFRLWGGWVGAGVALLLVVIAGAIFFSRMGESRALDRSRSLVQAVAPLVEAEQSVAEAADEEAGKASLQKVPEKAREAVARLDALLAKGLPEQMKGVAHFLRGAAALRAADWNAARDSFRVFVQADPSSPLSWVAWEAIGIASDLAGQASEAEAAFQQMTKAESAYARGSAWMHLGDLYRPGVASTSIETSAEKARDFYRKAQEALSGPEEALPVGQLLLRRLVEERLASLR